MRHASDFFINSEIIAFALNADRRIAYNLYNRMRELNNLNKECQPFNWCMYVLDGIYTLELCSKCFSRYVPSVSNADRSSSTQVVKFCVPKRDHIL